MSLHLVYHYEKKNNKFSVFVNIADFFLQTKQFLFAPTKLFNLQVVLFVLWQNPQRFYLSLLTTQFPTRRSPKQMLPRRPLRVSVPSTSHTLQLAVEQRGDAGPVARLLHDEHRLVFAFFVTVRQVPVGDRHCFAHLKIDGVEGLVCWCVRF